MSKHTEREKNRHRRLEAFRQREAVQRRSVKMKQRSSVRRFTTPILWTAFALVVVGLITFLTIRNQGLPANPAYPPVDKISCDAGEHTDFHIHAHLTLYINGQKMTAPAGVGIAPDTSCFYWLHTHQTDGVIHIEAPSGSAFTLKNFLDIWSGHFSQLGYPSELNQTTGWQAYVNGKPFTGDFRTIPLQAHALITLAYQSPGIHPDTSFNWNGL